MFDAIELFEEKEIRRVRDQQQEKRFFSVIDIVGILIEQNDYQQARNYWKVLKYRLQTEGSEVVTNCNQLKMKASDGKMYLTDVADVETIFRLVQSIPSKKAEPIKLRLARVGNERIKEMVDPAVALDRSRKYRKQQGRSDRWIEQRMSGQETRNKLTDYRSTHEVKEGEEFAILTNIIHEEWSGLSIKKHKKFKNLKSQNLRDHMSEAELIFTALAEYSTRQISEREQSVGLAENKISAKQGGQIAKDAKKALETKTGRKVVSNENFLPPKSKALKK